jgi:hypothetical protein
MREGGAERLVVVAALARHDHQVLGEQLGLLGRDGSRREQREREAEGRAEAHPSTLR